jgi:hypothetical protein
MPEGQERGSGAEQAAMTPTEMAARESASPTTWKSAFIRLLEPPVLIAVIILGGVSSALLREILGYSGMFASMRNPEYARGLITYLYAVVTIGTAVVLVVSALLGGDKVKQDDGRQILALLLGVFGTIVGFYFGNAVAGSSSQAAAVGLRLMPPLLSETSVVGGQTVHLTGAVSGGVPPYQFGVAVGADSLQYNETVGSDGWIAADLAVPPITKVAPLTFTLGVKDAAGTILTAAKSVTARPKE